ncbi:NAD-dependent epimerase/dehydratase family protein [Thermovibrio sp.]
MKRILIIGDAEFIGSHLCERLLNEGHIIYCVDNLVSRSFENIKHLTEREKFSFYKCDI